MFQESFAEAWSLRFGEQPPVDIAALGALARHRSVREYSDKPVEETVVRALMGTALGAATSSNLQLWSAVSVQNPNTREKVAKLCANYEHVRKAPWFFAFMADHRRLQLAAEEVGEEAAGLDYTEYFIMAIIDTALAAERFVCAAETLGLGICYIGALRDHEEEIAILLDLPEQTFGVFGLCLGWPSETCTAKVKPRLNPEMVWFRDSYPASFEFTDYNNRMRAFYESEKMKGDVTWSMRSARRVDEQHLTGREALLDWAQHQGFLGR